MYKSSNSKETTLVLQIYPRFLWFLSLAYAMAIVFANWFGPRIINIFGINITAGALIFPLTFLFSDLITEVYGYKHARRAIWAGFLFSAIFILYGQIIIHMPSPNYPTINAMFDKVMNLNVRIVIASIISYLTSEPLNAYVIAILKIKMAGKYMGIRFIASTIVASGVDSIIFCLIAFSNLLSHYHLIELIFSMWMIKVVIEILGLPISIRLAKKLKRLESLDIYDIRTKFNLFRLETQYTKNDNEYTKKHHKEQ
jgi:uncharacterized integral membrane protein (TIGR00697 family)